MPLGIDATIRYADEQLDRGRCASPSCERDTPVQHAPAPRPAADADRQPGPRLDQGRRATRRRRSYLFYVRKPGKSGEHAFSTTDAQFERDVGALPGLPRRSVTTYLGVCGWPVAHSRSPAMHNAGAAGRAASPTGSYLRAAAAAGAVRRDRARAARRRLPRRQRDDPAQGGGAGARRRGEPTPRGRSAPPTRSPSRTARILADNTDAPGLLERAARRGCDPAGRARARARRGRRRRAPRCGRSCRPARRGRGLEPDARAGRGARRRRSERAHVADPGSRPRSSSTARRSGLSPTIDPFKALPLKADTFEAGSCVVDMVYGPGGTRFLEAARARGARVVDGLEILVAQGAASFERWTGMMAPRQAMREAVRHRQVHESTHTDRGCTQPRREQRGITSPSRRGGSGRVLDRRPRRPRVRRARGHGRRDREGATRAGSAPERVLLPSGAITEDQLARAVAERFGLDHVDLRNYRVDPDAAKLVTPAAVKRYQAVPVVVRRRPHAAGRDGRPRERARGRRHRGHDRLRGAPGGRLARRTSSGCSSASRTPSTPRCCSTSTTRRTSRSRTPPRPGQTPTPARCTTSASRTADRLRLGGRGRVGHPARAPDHHRGGRARRLRHPLRAAGRRHARPLPHRRRAARRGDRSPRPRSRRSPRA